MNKTLKSMLGFGLGVCMTACIAACAAPPPSADSFAEQDLAETVNANIDKNTAASLSVACRADQSEINILEGVISAFNAEYPNIKVEITRVNGAAYDTTLASFIPAGTMTDLFWVNPNQLSYYYNNGVAFVLDNYFTQSNLDTTKYVAAAMEECQSPQDHYYMIPRDYVQLVMYYNKTMLAQLDEASELDVAAMLNKDWTWENFISICDEFKAKGLVSDAYPVLDVELDWESVYYPFIRSFGGEVIDENGQVVIDKDLETNAESNGAYQYLGELLKLKQKKILLPLASGTGASTNYYGGNSPFYIHSRSTLTQAYTALGNDAAVLPIPEIGSTPSVGAGCTGYAIYRLSKNKDAAWAFLRFMLSEQGQESLEKSGNVVPSLISEREKENPVWKQYPQGMTIEHDMFLAHSERNIDMTFLKRLPTETHPEALAALRTMYYSVLYEGKNRKTAIPLAADTMYNFLALGNEE